MADYNSQGWPHKAYDYGWQWQQMKPRIWWRRQVVYSVLTQGIHAYVCMLITTSPTRIVACKRSPKVTHPVLAPSTASCMPLWRWEACATGYCLLSTMAGCSTVTLHPKFKFDINKRHKGHHESTAAAASGRKSTVLLLFPPQCCSSCQHALHC